jgi:hypothetical protein
LETVPRSFPQAPRSVPLFPFGKLVNENDYSPSAGFVDRTDRTDSVKGFFQFLNSHMGTPFRAKMTAARLRFRAALVEVVTTLNGNSYIIYTKPV